MHALLSNPPNLHSNSQHPNQICLATLPLTPGLSASHSSLSAAYTKSVSKIDNAKFHTSVMA